MSLDKGSLVVHVEGSTQGRLHGVGQVISTEPPKDGNWPGHWRLVEWESGSREWMRLEVLRELPRAEAIWYAARQLRRGVEVKVSTDRLGAVVTGLRHAIQKKT